MERNKIKVSYFQWENTIVIGTSNYMTPNNLKNARRNSDRLLLLSLMMRKSNKLQLDLNILSSTPNHPRKLLSCACIRLGMKGNMKKV